MTLSPRVTWPLLGFILAVAAIVLLGVGHDIAFSGDDFSYWGREVVLRDHSLRHFDSLSLEYLFYPHNDHLQIGGKLVYEAVFAIFGSDYLALRAVGVLGIVLCLGLVFALLRRRVGDELAMLAIVLLGVLGASWEVLLWPFDMHTSFALAAGLGALLAVETKRRHGDLIACALLIVSCCFIELGALFVVVVAAAIAVEPGWRRRLWVPAVPAVLFVAWYIWAQRYDFEGANIDLSVLVPSIFRSAGAVAASLTGTLGNGDSADVNRVGATASAIALGIGLIVLLVARVWRTGFQRRLIPPLIGLGGYWCMIAFAARAEDSSRYVFVGAVFVMLFAAECLRGWRPGRAALALCALAVAVAIPANLAKLGDGAEYLRKDAVLTRGELAMIELAGDRADPEYQARTDPFALAVGASPYVVLPAADYLQTAEWRGSIAGSLQEARDANVFERTVFDRVLIDSIGVGGTPAAAPQDHSGCSVVGEVGPVIVPLPPEGALVAPSGRDGTVLGLSRFAVEHPVLDLGAQDPGEWLRLDLGGADAAPDAWRLFSSAPLEVCSL